MIRLTKIISSEVWLYSNAGGSHHFSVFGFRHYLSRQRGAFGCVGALYLRAVHQFQAVCKRYRVGCSLNILRVGTQYHFFC